MISFPPSMRVRLRRKPLELICGLFLGGLGLGWHQVAIANPSPPPAIHLYGQAATNSSTGATYMIFHIQQRQVVGAFYQRSSSFDCFYGEMTPTQLNLTVVDSFTQTAHPYALAVTPTQTEVAQTVSTAIPLQPQGFYAVQHPRQADLQVLDTCLETYPL